MEKLRFDVLKIDKAYVWGCGSNAAAQGCG